MKSVWTWKRIGPSWHFLKKYLFERSNFAYSQNEKIVEYVEKALSSPENNYDEK